MAGFAQTRWSIVLQAGNDSSSGRVALERLCRTYREPVLAYLLGCGSRSREQSEDLTQAFFARFLEHEWYNRADPCRGRFRTFLLVALKRFVRDADRSARAHRRGGGIRPEPLDDVRDPPPAPGASPEEAFEIAWAHAVLDAAMARLRAESERLGKLALFEGLRGFLLEPPGRADYSRAAGDLHMHAATVAVAVHRLRRRLMELVRAEVSDTAVGGGTDEEAEIRALRTGLRRAGRPPVDGVAEQARAAGRPGIVRVECVLAPATGHAAPASPAASCGDS